MACITARASVFIFARSAGQAAPALDPAAKSVPRPAGRSRSSKRPRSSTRPVCRWAAPLIAASVIGLPGIAAFASEPASQDRTDYEPLEMALTGDVAALRASAAEGNVSAQYAMWLLTFYVLRGQSADLAESVAWRERVERSGPQVETTVTQIIPGEGVRVARVEISGEVQRFDRAIGPCIGELSGHAPAGVACGSDPAYRQKLLEAWGAAGGRTTP